MKLLMKILDMLLHKANITLLFHRTAIGGLKSLLDESGCADLEIDLQGIERTWLSQNETTHKGHWRSCSLWAEINVHIQAARIQLLCLPPMPLYSPEVRDRMNFCLWLYLLNRCVMITYEDGLSSEQEYLIPNREISGHQSRYFLTYQVYHV